MKMGKFEGKDRSVQDQNSYAAKINLSSTWQELNLSLCKSGPELSMQAPEYLKARLHLQF